MNPREELDALLAEYRASLPQKLALIDALLAEGRMAELRRALHTLAGSAGTFGLASVGTAARAAEELLAANPLNRQELQRLLRVLMHEACVE